MRRRHTREDYLALVARLREAMPDIALSTDMIVGFPGETADDFDETLSLTEAVRYHSMFSFKYSPRPNTLALKRMPDDVPEEEKTRRIVALQALQRDVQGELYRQAVGTRRWTCWWIRAAGGATGSSRAARSGNTVVNFSGRPRTGSGTSSRCGSPAANPNSLKGEAARPLDTAAGDS